MPSPPSTRLLSPLSLVVAATVWGLVWYPYRLLQEAGLSGSLSSLLTYALGVPFLLWLVLARGQIALSLRQSGQRRWLLAVALTAGWTNLSYVLAVIHGEVMRVMLLFYLAPLWTLFFAWLILKEWAGAWGWAVTALALGGAYVMLGGERSGPWGLPLPATGAEWLGLSSGIGFALTNVLTRKARDIPIETRSLWVFAGVMGMSLLFVGGELEASQAVGQAMAQLTPLHWLWMAGITLALLLATFTVQYGLAHTPATPAVVILLFELVVAAVSSHYWAGETLGPREWLGGTMIAAATLVTLKLKHHD
ncbi:MAG: DMT family transporter [Pseudomonadota bacterium]